MGQTTDELRQDINERRNEISRDLDAIGDKVSPRQAARRTSDSARRKLHDMRDTVMGSATQGTSAISDAATSARDRIEHVPDAARRQTKGNPLAVGLVAFGGGLLLASIMKPTSREQQLASNVQPELERAASHLRETGQELAAELAEPARDAAESAGQRVREAAQAVATGNEGDGTS
jgi:hypothetical protein